MKRRFRLVFFVAALSAGMAAAAIAQDKTRPATARDFVGVFRLLDYPIQSQPKILKDPIFTSPCQFFGHYPDGYWLHQQSQGGTCTNAVPSVKPPLLPQTVQWKLVKDGAVLIDRKDYKIQEVWKVDRVNRPSNIANINLNEGDIIMQLLDKELKQVLWIRLLRRVGSASNT